MSEHTSTNKPQFRKRKKKKRNNNLQSLKSSSCITVDENYKQNQSASNDKNKQSHIEEEDDDLSFLSSLKETQTIHKLQFKTKQKGLVFEENSEFTASGLENPDNFRHDPSKDFGESFSTEKVQDDKLKKNKEKWIEDEMRNRLLDKGRILPQNEEKKTSTVIHKAVGNKTSLKEQLYALPEKLCTPLFQHRDNEEAGERWLAGMAEYELPLEYKLKNIEQTEDAKKKLLEPKPKHDKLFDIPRNYNQDFTTHHFDRVKSAEHKRKLQETQQEMNMEREKKRRRLMGTEWYTNTKTPHL